MVTALCLFLKCTGSVGGGGGQRCYCPDNLPTGVISNISKCFKSKGQRKRKVGYTADTGRKCLVQGCLSNLATGLGLGLVQLVSSLRKVGGNVINEFNWGWLIQYYATGHWSGEDIAWPIRLELQTAETIA